MEGASLSLIRFTVDDSNGYLQLRKSIVSHVYPDKFLRLAESMSLYAFAKFGTKGVATDK
jgi:hypothetical protein